MRYKFTEARDWFTKVREDRRLEQQWANAPLGVQADIMAAMQRRKES